MSGVAGRADREDASFGSGDGSCAAWLYRPRTADGSSPCIVMANGFSLTRHDGLPAYAERFAAAGFAVLVFDYRGFGDSPGSPRQRFRIRAQVADWRAAVAFARGDPGIDPRRMVLWGFSFSGGHAVTVAARDHGVAAALVLCPFVDGVRRVLATPPAVSARVMPGAIADWLGRDVTIPVTGPEGSVAAMSFAGEQEGFAEAVADDSPWEDRISPGIYATVAVHRPVRRAGSIRCPLWVGIGDRDITVDRAAAIRLAERAPRGEAHHYPMEHFEPLTPEGLEAILPDQLAFLERLG